MVKFAVVLWAASDPQKYELNEIKLIAMYHFVWYPIYIQMSNDFPIRMLSVILWTFSTITIGVTDQKVHK